ncbi:MAG: D-xylose ABC transporter ATP-binding protein [Acidobacteria bacterium RBG_13_68_16]|nr:MAG: D-xylose ABC transporter ATP-binding protein [Acidobacteria bacterium RBG_13_68_16]
MEGIRKEFPGVLAVRDASLDVRAGEVHALVGENGAGKSTLIRIVTGAHQADGGTVELNGSTARWPSPLAAAGAGIAAIYQELDMVPALSVRANLFLAREATHLGFIAATEERKRAREVLTRMGVDVDPGVRVGDLEVAQQQLVAIARALLAEARLLVMDEPTAALASGEVERLFGVMRELRGRRIGILFVSHRLDEVMAIADRVTVMRDGATLGTWPACELTRERLVELMVGRPLDQEFPKVHIAPGLEVLVVRNLSGGRVRDASLSIRAGEVLGIAGLVGAGRTDLARLIFGADPVDRGEILLDGRPVAIRTPRDAIRNGVCLLTEDRKAQGLVLGLSARDNFALPNLDRWSPWGWVRRGKELSEFERFVAGLRIRVAGPAQPARDLSGGNQQKLLLARWLERDSRVLIFDEPTRGIDVGAKHEIYLLINELVARGKAIVMISSDLPEVLGMSDRILVMHGGRVVGEIPEAAAATQEQVLRLAVG